MDVILLERIDNLGGMGDIVRVKPGYARNYLLPQKKALRATNENKLFYDAQKAALVKQNAEKRAEAEKLAAKLDGFKAVLVRNAAEAGMLYGSVTTRDIAEALSAQSKLHVARTQVVLNTGLKMIGLFPVTLSLHPEVKVDVIVNIARTEEEAKIQAKTGKALVAEDDRVVEAREKAEKAAAAAAAKAKADSLEAEGLAVESALAEEEAAKEAKKSAKKARHAAEDAAEQQDATE